MTVQIALGFQMRQAYRFATSNRRSGFAKGRRRVLVVGFAHPPEGRGSGFPRLRYPRDDLLSTSGSQILVLGGEVMVDSRFRVRQFNGGTACDWFRVCAGIVIAK